MMLRRVVAGALSFVVAVLAVALGPSVANAAPCEQLSDDMPCLSFSPESGAPGTFVTFKGHVDRDDLKVWKQSFGAHDLRAMYHDFPNGGPTGKSCELIVGLRGFRVNLDPASGDISGSFTVGSRGNCNQEQRSYSAYPGLYNLTAGCVACVFAQYRVTGATLPATGADTAGLVALGLGLCLVGACTIAMATRRGARDMRRVSAAR